MYFDDGDHYESEMWEADDLEELGQNESFEHCIAERESMHDDEFAEEDDIDGDFEDESEDSFLDSYYESANEIF